MSENKELSRAEVLDGRRKRLYRAITQNLKIRSANGVGEYNVYQLYSGELNVPSLRKMANKLNKQAGELTSPNVEAAARIENNEYNKRKLAQINFQIDVIADAIDFHTEKADAIKNRSEKARAIDELERLIAVKEAEAKAALGIADLQKQLAELKGGSDYSDDDLI